MVCDPALLDAMGGSLAKGAPPNDEDVLRENVVVRAALEQAVLKVQADLAGPAPTPLEALPADRIATCWLQLHIVEARYANAKGLSLAAATHCQRHIDRAHAR